jgi:hypothetical protein
VVAMRPSHFARPAHRWQPSGLMLWLEQPLVARREAAVRVFLAAYALTDVAHRGVERSFTRTSG